MQYQFLVTGGAGFIGSSIVEKLINLGHKVTILDDLSSGNLRNINSIINHSNLRFVQGDIRSFQGCLEVSKGVDYIIHQAALVSVPRSIEEPLLNNEKNIDGFLNILEAARINKVKRVVYASSSAIYGDNLDEIKTEERLGKTISPYALSKYVDELYASLYTRVYGLETVGLRYFNVYGPKQDPSSVYSGVISIFFDRLRNNLDLNIFGDGSVTRDFVYVEDVAAANISACLSKKGKVGEVYNIGTSLSTCIKTLAETIIKVVNSDCKINYLSERAGDIKYSCANISRARNDLEFRPKVKLEEGLKIIYKSFLK